MRAFFIIFLLVISLVFAFQNTAPISINFLFWGVTGSQALIIIITLFVGVIAGILLMLQSVYNKNKEIKALKKQIPGLNEAGSFIKP